MLRLNTRRLSTKLIKHKKCNTKLHQQEAANARKVYMKDRDNERVQNEPLNDIEEDELAKAKHMRERADNLLQEQEDDIKHLNEVCGNIKI